MPPPIHISFHHACTHRTTHITLIYSSHFPHARRIHMLAEFAAEVIESASGEASDEVSMLSLQSASFFPARGCGVKCKACVNARRRICVSSFEST
jgi:hypothetical protein